MKLKQECETPASEKKKRSQKQEIDSRKECLDDRFSSFSSPTNRDPHDAFDGGRSATAGGGGGGGGGD